MSSALTDQFAYHKGRTVGRYKLEELLGRGATAEVYKSVHPDLGRDIAIKILHPFQSHDGGFVQRFQNEAKAVASLIHPNIVQVYDFNVTEDNLYYITMQYVDGPTLDEYLDLKQSPLSLSKSIHIFNQVANALQFAHHLGIIHRDIKPANVMLDSRGDAFLGDFGFAQIIGVELHTQSSVTPGTPIYMAPEQIASSKVTAVADIYALGVILYQMLTAKIPYYGDNLMTVILRKLDEPPESPRNYNPDLPMPIEKVIMKAMARSPEERYQTVESMIAALHEAMKQSADSGINVGPLPGKEAISLPQRQIEGYKLQRGFSRDEMRSYQRYLAKDVKNDQRVIITVLREDTIDTEAADARFQKRAAQLLKLKQPGLAKIKQSGISSDRRPYVVYDYVPGQMLSSKLMESHRAGVEQQAVDTLMLVRRIATALIPAHLANLTHNDLRPEYIILDKEEKPTIVGMEIPQSANIALPKYWDELSYTPPEQVKERVVSVPGNVYTLGVILYELLAGQRPQVASHALLDIDDDFVPTAVPLHQVNPRLTEKTYEAVARSLAQTPSDRFKDLDTFITHLDAAIEAEKQFITAPTFKAKKTRRPSRRLLWTGSLVVLAIVVLTVLFAEQFLNPSANQVAGDGLDGTEGTTAVSTTTEENTIVAAAPDARDEATPMATAVGEPSAAAGNEGEAIDEEEAAANAQAALDARATAEAVEAQAEASARLATGRELAAAAITQLDSDPQLSLLLALEAINLTGTGEQAPPGEVIEALYRALAASNQAFVLASHTARVNDAVVSPDGRYIATASDDTTVKLWDAATGQELDTFTDHTNPVTSLAFSPDNIYLAAGSDDGLTIVWNLESGAVVRAVRGEDDGAVHSLAFHPDGQRLGVGYEEGTARVWDVATGASLLRQFEHSGPINDITFSPDGILFATAGEDGLLVTQNADTGQPIFSYFPEQFENGDPIAINGIAYNTDGTQIATARADGLALIWEGETLIAELPGHSGALRALAFSADGSRLVTASADSSAKLWDIETQHIIQTLSGHEAAVTAVDFTPDDEKIVTASEDGTARIWNVEFGLEPLTLSEHRGGINSIRYNADGTAVVTASNDNSARIWDANTGEVLQIFRGHDRAVSAAAFHPNLPILATASQDTNVRLWDLETGEVRLPFYFHLDAVNDLDFNEDGSLLATASDDGLVRLWQVETNDLVLELPHEEAVQSVDFHPDGRQLVVAVGDTAIIYDSVTGESGRQFSGHNGIIHSATFSPNGAQVATAGAEGVVKLWDVRTGETLRTFSGHRGPVLSVAFSPDGRQLATASVDKTAKLWDTETGQVIRTLTGHTSAVNAVAFDPANTTLATAGLDSIAKLTPLKSVNELVDQAWEHLTRPLSPDECAQYLRDLPCRTTSLDNAPPQITP